MSSTVRGGKEPQVVQEHVAQKKSSDRLYDAEGVLVVSGEGGGKSPTGENRVLHQRENCRADRPKESSPPAEKGRDKGDPYGRNNEKKSLLSKGKRPFANAIIYQRRRPERTVSTAEEVALVVYRKAWALPDERTALTKRRGGKKRER